MNLLLIRISGGFVRNLWTTTNHRWIWSDTYLQIS